MKKSENFRTLVIFIAFFVLAMVICLANIIKLNIFALVLDMIMIVSICFVLGYIYCRYERENEVGLVELGSSEISVPEEFLVEDEPVEEETTSDVVVTSEEFGTL